MALRPFITAGVAFAAAGAVAATVAIAPPMSPGEVKVAQNTEAQAKLAANLTDLINTFFGRYPGDGENSGTVGASGVLQQLLLNANEGDLFGQAAVNALFGSGLSDLVRLYLVSNGTDAATNAQINTFFNGGLSELVRLRLLWSTNDPSQIRFINTLFGGATNDDGGANVSQAGFSGLAYNFITGTGLSADQQEALDIFFNRGTLNNNGTPTDPTDDFYVGNSNPAYRGTFGLIYRAITDSGLSPDQQETLDQLWDGGASLVVKERLLDSTTDPTQRLDIESLFDGGISENFRWRLIAGANGDQRSINLTNEFFDNGISGVIRYLLVGPVVEPEEPEEPEEPSADESLRLASASVEDAGVAPAVQEEAPEEALAPAPSARKAAAAVQAEAPAPAAEPVSAPAPAPAAAPATAPAESTSSVKEEAAGEEAEDTGVKDGNKVEPEIIIPGGAGSKNGSGSWGIFGDVAQAVVKHITGGTKAPAAGSGGTTGGTTDGGTADGADNDGGDGAGE